MATKQGKEKNEAGHVKLANIHKQFPRDLRNYNVNSSIQ